MKRVMCLWLPQWPIQRLRAARPELATWDRTPLLSSADRSGVLSHGRSPLVLFTTAARGKKVAAFCSQEAAGRGILPGMPLAEAKALAGRQPPIHFEPYDAAADRAALRQLALACQQFGPYAAIEDADPPECLLVDVTGCGPIFGGEERLAEQAVQELRRRGYIAGAAVADTIGAAWAAAHVGHVSNVPPEGHVRNVPHVIPPGAHPEALRPLPVETLRLPLPTLALLHALDLRRIGQLLELPRAELPARFGPEVVQRLDQALGLRAELMTPEKDDEPIEVAWELDYPSGDRRVIEKVLDHLVQQVVEKLQPRGLGVQRLVATLRTNPGEANQFPSPPVLRGRGAGVRGNSVPREDRIVSQGTLTPSPPTPLPLSTGGEGSAAKPVCLSIGLLAPSASAGHLLELIRLQCERLQLTAEVAAITLRVLHAAPVEFRQGQIFAADASQRQREQFPMLVERLTHRLGEQAVLHPYLRPDAQPELAWRYEPWLKSSPFSPGSKNRGEKASTKRSMFSSATPAPVLRTGAKRPPCLKPRPVAVPVMSVVPEGPPVRFQWHNVDHVVAHWWGPERIETGWWRGRDVRRDYYLVETTTGARFWLFRERSRQTWFLHGND